LISRITANPKKALLYHLVNYESEFKGTNEERNKETAKQKKDRNYIFSQGYKSYTITQLLRVAGKFLHCMLQVSEIQLAQEAVRTVNEALTAEVLQVTSTQTKAK
jgi:hypothetical protein